MATRSKKINSTEAAPAELEPVNLDPIPEDPAEAVLRRIEEFQESLPTAVHKWTVGAPAPEWMGTRPVWAEDHYHAAKGFIPARCFWQGDEIEMPAMNLYGAKSDDEDYRFMGSYKVFLRQYHREREPYVFIRVGPKGNTFDLALTLAEVDDLVAAVEMLADIAKQGMATDRGDEK